MAGRIKVLVVDDSASVRLALMKGLSTDAQIEVVGMARDGAEALRQVKTLRPDVVTLDIVMPHVDGLHALEEIMAERPTPVIMVSSLTGPSAETTVQALELGAVDFVLKPSARGSSAVNGLLADLQQKIRDAVTARVLRPWALEKRRRPAKLPPRGALAGRKDRTVVIASSTGGPQALRLVIGSLPANLPAAVLAVQHLPAAFTPHLAASLDTIAPIAVEEARQGTKLSAGRVLIAPGDVHTRIGAGGTIGLDLGKPELGLRPAANVTMESAATVYGASTVGVVLTGMGSDGTRGAGAIKSAGGVVVAEDESTCMIYGMPRSVAEAGYADEIVPLPSIADTIVRICQTSR